MFENTNNDFEVPSRFRRAVGLHIVKNSLQKESLRVPLILGIHGPSGEGKTFQCERILGEINAKPFLISGGQLESRDAGEPARLVRTMYLNAGRSVEKGECKIAVVVINDIDTGLGDWGDMVQYTTNRQAVFGELMHLVDYPTNVEGRSTKRVPIIITGNDFTKLYDPLVRAGRMTAFAWIPTVEEKAVVVSRIFPELDLGQCRSLISRLESHAKKSCGTSSIPVATFSHLRSILWDDYLWGEIERVGLVRTIELISNGCQPRIEPKFEAEQLLDAGKALIASGQLLNHLERAK